MNKLHKLSIFILSFLLIGLFTLGSAQAKIIANKQGRFNQNPVCKTSIEGEGRVKAKVCIAEFNGWMAPSVTFLDPSTCVFTVSLNDVTTTYWWVNWGEGKVLSSLTYTIHGCRGQYSTKAIGLINGRNVPAISGHIYRTYVNFVDYNGQTWEYDPPQMTGHVIGK